MSKKNNVFNLIESARAEAQSARQHARSMRDAALRLRHEADDLRAAAREAERLLEADAAWLSPERVAELRNAVEDARETALLKEMEAEDILASEEVRLLIEEEQAAKRAAEEKVRGVVAKATESAEAGRLAEALSRLGSAIALAEERGLDSLAEEIRKVEKEVRKDFYRAQMRVRRGRKSKK